MATPQIRETCYGKKADVKAGPQIPSNGFISTRIIEIRLLFLLFGLRGNILLYMRYQVCPRVLKCRYRTTDLQLAASLTTLVLFVTFQMLRGCLPDVSHTRTLLWFQACTLIFWITSLGSQCIGDGSETSYPCAAPWYLERGCGGLVGGREVEAACHVARWKFFFTGVGV